MPEGNDVFEIIQARRYLEEVNNYILHNEGEIMVSPGKISLVWTDSNWNIKRFLAVKMASDEQILINGRRYPATENGLKQGLVACLADMRNQ
jgi:hypothetical protein